MTTLTESQATTIKKKALTALQTAFAGYKVQVGAGRVGSNTVYVVGDLTVESCGATTGNNTAVSRVFYPNNMAEAQHALNATNGIPTNALVQAIGEGIGNNAAHEIAHQLKTKFARFPGKVVGGMGMDDTSVDTYNSGGCDGSAQSWVYTGFGTDANRTPIHWEDVADQSLTNILGKKP